MKRLLPLLLLLTACHPIESPDGLVCIQIQDRNGLTETISAPDRLATFDDTNFLATQPYKKVLRVFRQEGKNRSTLTTYHPNGQPHQYLEAREMRAQGAYREWHPNGQLKIEATVIGGVADLSPGSETTWLFDGASHVYAETGQLTALIPYEKGVLQGDLLNYNETGALVTRSHYANDLLDGKSFSFWPDRSPAYIETYSAGRLTSAYYWTPAGDLIATVENGSGWQVRGDTHIQIANGIPDGLVRTTLTQYTQKNGKKQGEELTFYSPNLPKLSLMWDNDQIHGLVKTWYADGALQSQREFAHNEKMGLSLGWYSDGTLMFREEYEHDALTNGQYFKRGDSFPISTVINGTGTATLFDDSGHLLQKIPYPLAPE